MEIPLTIVDFVVLGILLISGLIAAYRGFMKETLTVSAWFVAALAAVFVWPAAKPFARSLLQPDMLADILALIGVFFLMLIPASFVSFRLTEMVRGSRAGPLDRSLGFVFGLARGLLVVGLGYIVYSSLAPSAKQPDWVREARLLPVVKGTADVILSFGAKKKKTDEDAVEEEQPVQESDKPKPAEKGATTAQKKPVEKTDTDNKEGGGDNGKAYDAGDRRALDQLVRSASKP